MILDRILETTRGIVARRKTEVSHAEIERRAARAPRALDFYAALRRPGIGAIAEIKRASPSKGVLRADLDAPALARTYEVHGAAAISVLTEPEYFQGSLEDLAAVRQAVGVPLLRKDFVLDPYQVYEARAYGADTFLLIVAALPEERLAELLALGRQLGMTALVEVHDAREVAKALAAGAEIVGVNNRDLKDFSVDLGNTVRLRPLVPRAKAVVAESGIHSRADVTRLAAAGVDAILVGEALVTSEDAGQKLRELVGTEEA